jgi:hypothetical protein
MHFACLQTQSPEISVLHATSSTRHLQLLDAIERSAFDSLDAAASAAFVLTASLGAEPVEQAESAVMQRNKMAKRVFI